MNRLIEIVRVFMVLLCISVTMGAIAQAKGKDAAKAEERGYCCYNGKIVPNVTQKECQSKGGFFSKHKSEIQQKCTPAKSTSSPVQTEKTVLCCVNYQIREMSADQCKRENGRQFDSKAAAVRMCKPDDIYCCVDFQVREMSAEQCKRENGKEFGSKAEAARMCRPEDIYCCIKGKAQKATEKECRQYTDKTFNNLAAANRQCEADPVYCCLGGRVAEMPLGKCTRNQGTPYWEQSTALARCKPEERYCCVDGTVLRISDPECDKRGGSAYADKAEANRQCLSSPVYCCADGKVQRVERRVCKQKHGKPFENQAEAYRTCQRTESFCCVDGQIQMAPNGKCIAQGGDAYSSREEALRKCKPSDTKAAEGGGVAGRMKIAIKDARPGKKGPATHMGAALDLPQGQGPEMVPLFQDRGIVISEPAASSDVRRGGSVRVTYTVADSASVGGSYIAFFLYRPMTPGMDDYGSEPVATISHRHALQDTNQDIPHSFLWTLPEDIAVADDYIIRARLNDDVWGESHQFSIRDLLDREAPGNHGVVLDRGIVISEPAASSDVRRGTSVRVTYTVEDSASVGGSTITFSLYRPTTPGMFDYSSEPVATISHRHALQETNQDIAHSFFWPLPEDVPVADNYIMRARLSEDVWGESARFDIRHLLDPVEANHSGEENGIGILYPEGGETFRPGGTMPFRWNARSTAARDLDSMDIQLLPNCEHLYSYRPSIVSGDPSAPNSASVLRLPEDMAQEGLYCLYAEDRDHASVKGYSRTFEIRRQSGSFGEGSGSDSTATEPQLEVLSPGTGGEHWRLYSEHPIKWRFHPGVEATLPGTWTIILYKYDPSSGYSPAHTFVAETYDVRQVAQGGLTWYEYTYNWNVQGFGASSGDSGEYKIGVSAMGYQDQGSLNFTIGHFSQGHGWNLKISEVKVENMQLIAMVENQSEQDEGGVSGRLDFSVEVGGAVRQVTASAPPQTARSHSEPVVLGQLNTLVADLSQFECAIPVRVTIDSTDRVEETNEEDNVFSGEVYSSNRALSINLRLPYGDSTFNGAEVQCGVDASDIQMIAMIELKNCGTMAVSGNIRVTQSGWWSSSEPGTLSGPGPATWHDEETILNQFTSVGPPRDLSGIFPSLDTDTTYIPVQVQKRHLRRDYQGRIVDSEIHIYFEGNFGSYALHNPWNLLLNVVE